MFKVPTPTDSEIVVALSISSGLFPAEAAEVPAKMMEDYFHQNQREGHRCLLQYDKSNQPIGVAYLAPVVATDRVWNLLMIAINESHQGQGFGSKLVDKIEEDLKESNQRLLLVETSGLPEFEQTRSFYKKLGFTEEARVRDYYEDSNDMILFRKEL